MKRWCIMWPICMCMYVLGLLTCFFKSAHCLPVTDKETESRLTNLTGYDILTYSGRTLKAIDWEACEFGHTLQPYDETCPNGATNLLPCNPGQLKVAECIGQGGDTSRVCDPCPQKFFQSSYNRCTACHECSECRPDEQIKEPCSDETDTVCESIIAPPPPPPEPTITDVPVPPLSTQIPDEDTPTVQDPTSAVPSESTTKKVPITEGPPTVQTTQNVSPQGPDASIGKGLSAVTLGIGIIAAISWIVIIFLVIALWITCRRWKEEQRKNEGQNNPNASPRGSPQGSEPVGSASVRNGSYPPQVQSNPVMAHPIDDGSLHVDALLSSNIEKDFHRKRKAPSSVAFKNEKHGDPEVEFVQNCPLGKEQHPSPKFNSGGKDGEIKSVESLRNGDGIRPEPSPPVNSSANDNPCPWNEKVSGSINTTTTADVHNCDYIPGGRERGDGDNLVRGDVVHDGHLSHSGDSRDPDLGDQDTPGRRPSHNLSHRPPTDGLHVHSPAGKVPGSFASLPTSTENNVSSTDVPRTDLPALDSDERLHAEKVPGSFALPPNSVNSNVTPADVPSADMPSSDSDERGLAEKIPSSDPDIVTDASSDNPPAGDHENNPRTLRSSVERWEAPMAGEEESVEDDLEATAANNIKLNNNDPNADTDGDVAQRLTGPEVAFNNTEDNTIPPGEETHEDDVGQRKFWDPRYMFFQFFKKQRRKTHNNMRNHPTQQMQPLLDQMVDEKCLEYVADELKLSKLDKLCRELGLKEKDVENHKFDLKDQNLQGTEVAFKMLMRIRDTQGRKFSYCRLEEALRASKNAPVADGMVSKFQLNRYKQT